MFVTSQFAAYALWTAMLVSWMLAAFWADRAARRAPALAELGYIVVTIIGFYLLFAGGRSIYGQPETYAYLSLYWTWGPKDASEPANTRGSKMLAALTALPAH